MSTRSMETQLSGLTAVHRWLVPRIPRLARDIAVVVGLLILVGVVLHRHLLTDVLPLPAGAAAEAVSTVAGWLLLRLARGLGRRKRAEWRIAVAACAVLLAVDVLRDGDRPIETALTAVLLAALLAARRQFVVSADPHGRWFAARAAGQLLATGALLGTVMLYLPHHVPAGTGFWSRMTEVASSLVGMGGGLAITGDDFADVFHAVLLAFGVAAVVALVSIGLRAPEPAAVLAEHDEQQLRALLERHGARDSLGYFALRRDKAVVWSPSAKAAVAYRVVHGVALASGDPIGDSEAWPGAIRAWRELVDEHGWTPAVIGCGELGATAYRRDAGLSTIALGDEAIVHTAEFTLDGRAMRGVRQPCARLRKAGYLVDVRRARELDETQFAELRSAAADWRADPVERGFSMALSRLGDPADADCVVVTARFDGRLCGFLHFVPWSGSGISLDVMRRDRNADNGLNELMIASLLESCAARGITEVSLNFAVFRDALERGEQLGAGPVARLWRRILLIASKWWQIDSLYRFNDKFRPTWQPRYFSYPRARDLPRIALAALEAEAFVAAPRSLNRLVGRAVGR